MSPSHIHVAPRPRPGMEWRVTVAADVTVGGTLLWPLREMLPSSRCGHEIQRRMAAWPEVAGWELNQSAGTGESCDLSPREAPGEEWAFGEVRQDADGL